ncbi:MAG: DNA replication and repair protein RecF [Candidatus Microgenomates bacterium]|jgi:DNA replication and repair protein RecF
MQILKLRLSDFRNFGKKLIEFNPGINVITGPNGSGKTNILESLQLLATGKSFKAKVEQEMINYGKDIGRVKARIKYDGQISDLEVTLTRGLIDIGSDHPEKVAKKRLTKDGLPKRLVDFAGSFKVVIFGPWDLDLVTTSPSLRRRFLDTVLSQTDREYRRSILSYEKGLRQRNRLLYKIREGMISTGQLVFWNQLLIKNGDYISGKREELIEYINSREALGSTIYSLEYDKSIISEGRLEDYKEEEVAAATTLVGPHRDDMLFRIKNKKFKIERDLSSFGSRGEQRMGVLWLKMAELSFVESVSGERPTLLLDDIFSELDERHRKIVIGVVDSQQTIITTTDEHITGFKKVEKIRL